MKQKLTPMALAVCAALPLAASAAPKVSFVAPQNGATITSEMYQSGACEVNGTGIRRVVFFLDGTQLNTESSAPWNCNLDPKDFASGAHKLRAVLSDVVRLERVHPCERARPARAAKIDRRRPGMY